MSLIVDQATNILSVGNLVAPPKAVHFDVEPNEESAEQVSSARPRRSRNKCLKEPTPMPRQVYGLYLPLDACVMIGLQILPGEDFSTLDDDTRDNMMYLGILCSNSHGQDKFPHIPLRWRSSIYVICEQGMRPLIVLGHRYGEKDPIIYVCDEQVEELRAYLKLGNQQPAWYCVEKV